MMQQSKPISELIRLTYGSLESPDFSFVADAVARRPHEELARELSHHFEVSEDTDPNDDVSFVYQLRRGGSTWILRVSMVGPYAILLRLVENGGADVISDDTAPRSESETDLLKRLSSRQLQVLDRDTLLQPVPLMLFNTAPENTRIYQALFCDSDILPWEGAEV